MNKKLVKQAICFLTLLVLMAPIMVAADTNFDPNDYLGNLNVPTGEDDLANVVVEIINVVLGLLGLIAVVIVLIGGFEWMTAGGADAKVETAQKRMKYGLIGLFI